MRSRKNNPENIRHQIMKSAIKSFKIEGIYIPLSTARDTLKKVELSLKK